MCCSALCTLARRTNPHVQWARAVDPKRLIVPRAGTVRLDHPTQRGPGQPLPSLAVHPPNHSPCQASTGARPPTHPATRPARPASTASAPSTSARNLTWHLHSTRAGAPRRGCVPAARVVAGRRPIQRCGRRVIHGRARGMWRQRPTVPCPNGPSRVCRHQFRAISSMPLCGQPARGQQSIGCVQRYIGTSVLIALAD